MDKELTYEPKVPSNWTYISTCDKTATNLRFVGGYNHPSRKKVLVWAAPLKEEKYKRVTRNGNAIPDPARYVIETVDKGEIKNESFATKESYAFAVARFQAHKIFHDDVIKHVQ